MRNALNPSLGQPTVQVVRGEIHLPAVEADVFSQDETKLENKKDSKTNIRHK